MNTIRLILIFTRFVSQCLATVIEATDHTSFSPNNCVTVLLAAHKHSPGSRILAYQQSVHAILSCPPVVHSTVIKSQSTFSPNQSLWAFRSRRSIPYNYCAPRGAPISGPGYILSPQSSHLDHNNSLGDKIRPS